MDDVREVIRDVRLELALLEHAIKDSNIQLHKLEQALLSTQETDEPSGHENPNMSADFVRFVENAGAFNIRANTVKR